MNCFALISPKQCSTLIFDAPAYKLYLRTILHLLYVLAGLVFNCVFCGVLYLRSLCWLWTFWRLWDGDNGFWRQGKGKTFLFADPVPCFDLANLSSKPYRHHHCLCRCPWKPFVKKSIEKKKLFFWHYWEAFSKTEIILIGVHSRHPDIILFYVLRKYY